MDAEMTKTIISATLPTLMQWAYTYVQEKSKNKKNQSTEKEIKQDIRESFSQLETKIDNLEEVIEILYISIIDSLKSIKALKEDGIHIQIVINNTNSQLFNGGVFTEVLEDNLIENKVKQKINFEESFNDCLESTYNDLDEFLEMVKESGCI